MAVSKKVEFFGKYELLDKVGSGGMGSVFKARAKGQEEVVALKIASAQVASSPLLCKRFENEFKIASNLQHPNLVRALSHGLENGTPYLVMEFVPGQSLDKRIREKGPLPLMEALTVFDQVGAALTYIHQNQLIHRDIKPGNILLDLGGQAKLADLGLIKDLGSQTQLTMSRMGLGTMEYCAPEQFDDAKHVDVRCDVYGLGASLYVALTGKSPFGPGSQMRILTHKLAHQFIPLSQLIEGVSPALDQVINRSLHPKPEVRPASIADFLAEMRNAEAPKTPLIPKPVPQSVAAVEKRQKGQRHPVRLNTTLGVLNAADHETWPAEILDISSGGLCLQIPRRFQNNTLVNVFLPEEKTGEMSAHLVRICWTKNTPDKTWLHGCLFVSPLENQDVDRFLFNDLAPTNMTQNPET